MVGTLTVLSTKATTDVVGIMVGDPLDWSIFSVGPGERICKSFDDYLISFYECMLTRIGLWVPLSNFKVASMKHLKVSPS